MGDSSTFSILVVGGTARESQRLARELKHAGFAPFQATDTSHLRPLANQDISAAILIWPEKRLPNTAVNEIHRYYPETQVVVVSPHQSLWTDRPQFDRTLWYISTVQQSEELLLLIAKACALSELKSENRSLKTSVGNVVGDKKSLGASLIDQEILEKVERLSQVDTTILLKGETGTGKSTLARLIHAHSARSEQSFISISCAAIPRDLLEAELFGYEKGAFTGAVVARAGCMELANSGTLFLDEIADLPLELQPKLLNVLQDRELRRLGATKTKAIDVRIIAASNRDIEMMTRNGEFREELFYRLNVLALTLPPLRQRKSELETIASLILSDRAARMGRGGMSLSSGALKAIRNYNWPGNFRELENVLERSCALASQRIISEEDLDLPAPGNATQTAPADTFIGSTLAQIERRAIEDVLKHHNGNKTLAAKSLGISLKTLYNKLATYH